MMMKINILVMIIFFLIGCGKDRREMNRKDYNYPFYVGTYTNNQSQGIYEYILQKDGTLQKFGSVAIADNPAYLAISPDKKYLLAVSEVDSHGVGKVESYLIKYNRLVRISSRSSGGAHPCFITINRSGYVLVANYTGGSVGLFKLQTGGILSSLMDLQDHWKTNTSDSGKTPHAHSAWFFPDDHSLICIDKGTDELWFSILDTVRHKFVSTDPGIMKMDPDSGPRHLAIHPNGKWIYVLNELNSTITLVIKAGEKDYRKGVSISTLPSDYTGQSICADIKISSDGKFLYASNRGHDSITIFKVDTDKGNFVLIGYQNCYGKSPRNISLSPGEKFLLVANRYSNNIVSFKRNPATGMLTKADIIDAPTPACIVF